MAKILIIDDDEDVRTLLTEYFSELNQGHQTETAQDGMDGIMAAKRFMPDIIIVDLDMPRLNGYGVCRRLREDPATAKTGILMLTGLNDLSGPTTGLASGADDHITKPFNINEVGARAQALLQRRK